MSEFGISVDIGYDGRFIVIIYCSNLSKAVNISLHVHLVPGGYQIDTTPGEHWTCTLILLYFWYSTSLRYQVNQKYVFRSDWRYFGFCNYFTFQEVLMWMMMRRKQVGSKNFLEHLITPRLSRSRNNFREWSVRFYIFWVNTAFLLSSHIDCIPWYHASLYSQVCKWFPFP